MGSRGLGSKLGYRETPTKWEINHKNAIKYGIQLKEHHTNKIVKDAERRLHGRIDESLATINQMGELLGMRPDELPKVVMHYGKYSISSFGDTALEYDPIIDKKTGEIIFEPDAIINIYTGGLTRSELTTNAHEMYHAMEAMWIKQDFSSIRERANAWIDNTYSESICHNALVDIGKQDKYASIDNKAWKEQAQTIYRDSWEKDHPDRTYASTEGRGRYAETVTCTIEAALRYGEKNISPYGQAIIKELRKEIRRHRIKQKHRRKGGKQ